MNKPVIVVVIVKLQQFVLACQLDQQYLQIDFVFSLPYPLIPNLTLYSSRIFCDYHFGAQKTIAQIELRFPVRKIHGSRFMQ
jgi:hypothetical protein